jgi:hypothetical protein
MPQKEDLEQELAPQGTALSFFALAENDHPNDRKYSANTEDLEPKNEYYAHELATHTGLEKDATKGHQVP